LLKKLNFESSFFSINYAETNTIDQSEKLLQQYDIVQLFSKYLIPNNIVMQTRFIFEDTKVKFKKDISSNPYKGTCQVIKATKPSISNNLVLPLVTHSRFKHITSTTKCFEFYKLWIEKSILGNFDNEGYIIKNESEIIAFISIRVHKKNISIGLITVHPSFQSIGLGYSLLSFVEDHFYKLGFETLSVDTEGKNLNAIKFYTRYGFTQTEINYWYYWRR